MKGKRPASRSHAGQQGGEEGAASQLRGEIMLGELLWVRLHGSSWWPAQVVDANTVSENIKPSNRSVGEVLVRLYGSYKYVYVDPMKCRSEFENILEHYNGSYTEIFKKALEGDLSHSKYGRSKGQGSKSKVGVEVSHDEKLKQNCIEENQEIEASKSRSGVLGKHPTLSVRVTRAQKANLVAKSPKDNVSENEGTEQDSVKKSDLVNNGTSYQARVSTRGQLAANTLQTMVRNGNLFSEENEEAKRKTSKQGEMQKKLERNSSSGEGEAKCRTSRQNGVEKKPKPNSQSIVEKPLNNSGQDEVQKKLKLNNPSINEEATGKSSRQDGVQKKLRPNRSSVKGEGNSKTLERDGEQKKRKPISPGAEKQEKSKTSKQDGTQKKLKVNSPSTKEKVKDKTSTQAGLGKKHKSNSASVADEAKGKTSKQDETQKKRKLNGSTVEEQTKIKTFKRDGVRNKLKRNGPSVEEEAKNRTPKQATVQKKLNPNSPSAEEEAKSSKIPKEDRMHQKLKPNIPNSETTPLGKPQELSARRKKVMQSLGLIAPFGSPFNRDERI